jgi:DNA-binding response OmpR family regulator
MATILIVEDDLSLAELLAVVLEEAGYEVCLAPHGNAALRQLATQPPDLVVSDLMMPELDGRGLWQRMQEDSRYATIPLILMSAVRALIPGQVPFLPKPFEAEQLLSCIGQILSPATRTEVRLA